MQVRTSPLALLAVLALLGGCAAPQAVLYVENPARRPAAQQALQGCERQAQQTVGYNAGNQATGRKTGKAGATAATKEATRSMIRGSADVALKTVAAGVAGAASALTGQIIDWNQPDDVYERYVRMCMKRHGHEVLGWR